MVQTLLITQAKLLDMYARKAIEAPITVTIGGQQRVYARSTEGQASNPDGYIVVYAVIT